MSGHNIIIQNQTGKYLMQFRDNTTGIENPLKWDFFGGSSENDETVIQAAIRELQEELNIQVSDHELKVLGHHILEHRHEYILKYSEFLDWTDFIINEGAGGAFLSQQEILQLPSSPRVKFLTERYLT